MRLPKQVPFPTFYPRLLTHSANPLGPPRSAQNQEWRGESNFVDTSGPIFSMYMEMAEEEDEKMAESWKADAEGILVFVRHYLLVPCFTLTRQS
jgi:hypothetical protein